MLGSQFTGNGKGRAGTPQKKLPAHRDQTRRPLSCPHPWAGKNLTEFHTLYPENMLLPANCVVK